MKLPIVDTQNLEYGKCGFPIIKREILSRFYLEDLNNQYTLESLQQALEAADRYIGENGDQ